MNPSFTIAVISSLLVAPLGCASIWRDVPLDEQPPANVRFDAAWYSENASPDVIKRLKDQRQQQVSRTISDRAEGKVGVSLSELISGQSLAGGGIVAE